jgi:hypothetical protein
MARFDKMRPAPICMGIRGEQKLPQKYLDEVLDVMHNVEKIKGDAFAHTVKFLMNVEGLIGMFASATTIDSNVDEKAFKEAISNVASILVGMYCDAVEIDQEEDMKEITKTAKVIGDILKKAGKDAH